MLAWASPGGGQRSAPGNIWKCCWGEISTIRAAPAPAAGGGPPRHSSTERERERERERQGEEEAMDREDIVRGEPTSERGNQEGNHTTLLVADEIGQVKGEYVS